MNEHDNDSVRPSIGCDSRATTDVATADRQHAIDRLVAGDLNETERDELLAWLDTQPLRWRSCALAFLEAQMWREGFGSLCGTASSDETNHTSDEERKVIALPTAVPSPALRNHEWRAWSAVAAAVVAAFALGITFDETWRTRSQRDVAASPIASRVESNPDRADRTRSYESGDRIKSSDTATSRDANHGHAEPGGDSSGRTVALLTIRPDERDGIRELTIPVLDSAETAAQVASADRPPLSDYDRRRLERLGYHVKQSRGFVPIALADGRKIVIPVDEVKLQHVKHGSTY